jgi:hypothetical protein
MSHAILRIQNDTGQALTLVCEHLDHGKYKTKPPETIASGATGTFEVEDHDLVGPEGIAEYQVGGGVPVTLTFYWNHPHGTATSAYSVGSNPQWYASYTLDPPAPSGENQDVTYQVSLNPDGFDPRRWMEQLSDAMGGNMVLRTMVLPGSHDAGTYGILEFSPLALDYEGWIIPYLDDVGAVAQWSRAQDGPVYDQLCAGVRYLDLRVSNGVYVTSAKTGEQIVYIGPDDPIPEENGVPVPNVVRREMWICHSLTSVPVDAVLADVARFMAENPREVVLLNFQHFYGMTDDSYEALLGKLQDTLGQWMAPRTESADVTGLTLEWFWQNGRVVVFFDQDHVVINSGHPNVSFVSFELRFPALYGVNRQIWSASTYLCDNWYDEHDVKTQAGKLAEVLCYGLATTRKFFVLQCVVTPSNAMYGNEALRIYPDSLKQLGMGVSPYMLSCVQNDWASYALNVVLLDWIQPSLVTQLAYMLNQRVPPPSIDTAPCVPPGGKPIHC